MNHILSYPSQLCFKNGGTESDIKEHDIVDFILSLTFSLDI